MALNARADMVPPEYAPSPPPFTGNPDDETVRYLVEELDTLKATLAEVIQGLPQVTNKAPTNPRRGMIRFCVSPWDPLGTSFEGYVVYGNAGTWVAL